MFNDGLIAACVFLFPETSASKILGNKAKTLSKETGHRYLTEYSASNKTLASQMWTDIGRPVRMLATQSILLLVSVFTTYTFGALYLVLSTYATLWTEVYHQTVLQSGLHYLTFAIGYTVAEQVGAVLTDHAWAYLTRRYGRDGSTVPEYRLPLMIPGALLLPIGLLWYGWSAQRSLYWLMPDIGVTIFACGFMMSINAIVAYILDSFENYTASASAASQVLRMIAGFAFPLFAPAMYARFGWG